MIPAMSQPTTRVLALLEMLQAREVTGGAELARVLESTAARCVATS
jgi:hypothetical protein